MLRINLASSSESVSDETHGSAWYIFDLIVLAVVAAAGYFGVQYYMSAAKDSIEIIESETRSIRESIGKLQQSISRFDDLEADIRQLSNKVEAIKSITVSVFERYKLLIVLEHLQILQPSGVWYDSLVVEGNKINIKGAAFNNILVAELLTALESTKTQEVDPVDLRTYVYFDPSRLLGTEATETQLGGEGADTSAVNFILEVGFQSQSYEQVRDENSKELAVNDVR